MKLRSTLTGVVVSVNAEKAARLGREWQPVMDEPVKPKTAPRSKKST